MRRFIFFLSSLMVFASIATAQNYLPDRKQTVFLNHDFAGNDLQQLFDTSQQACANACASDPACVAYTFNRRSNSCFPKSSIREMTAYEGAVSVRMAKREAAEQDTARARAAALSFLRPYDLQAARSEAAKLPSRHPSAQWSVQAMREAVSERQSAGDQFNAMRWMGAITAQTDASADWAAYARLMLALPADKQSEKRRNAQTAMNTAITAYLRSASADEKAEALLQLSEALSRLGRGEDMIPTLKLAASHSADPRIAPILAEARAKYGFRVVDTRVESDLASPRICAVLSEDIAEDTRDLARFVALPDPRLAVSVQGRDLCVTGLDHGARAALTLRAGLPAKSGEGLVKDTPLSFYVKDRTASAGFPGRAYVLPLGGAAALPIETVNTSEVALTLRRVSDRNLIRAMQDDLFARPLYQYQEALLGSEIGEEIWRGIGEVDNRLNEDVLTRLPIAEAIADQPAGIYVMSAKPKGVEGYGSVAQQWFVLSDIGLGTATGADGIHVFARSLATAELLEGVTVRLVARSNRVLGEAVTDAQGMAKFSAPLGAGTGGASPALVLAEMGDNDMAFLSLTDPAFDLSDRGVKGRNAPGAVDLFVATDRGAYRAGETIFATALLRDSTAAAIEGMPLTGVLLRPDGVEYSRHLSTAPKAGGHVFSLPVSASAPRGSWTFELRADADGEALASARVLVEDFTPERIDYYITLTPEVLRFGAPASASLSAEYLFGAPAADLRVSGKLRLSARRALEAYPGFVFGPQDAGFRTTFQSLGQVSTDAAGKASLNLPLPEVDAKGLPLEARVIVEVSEGSNRPVERSTTAAVMGNARLLGLKPLFEGAVSEGDRASFDVLALSPEHEPISAETRWTLNKVHTRFQWYEQNGRWTWEPIITRAKAAEGTLSLGEGRGALSLPVKWGEYELVVSYANGEASRASHIFYAGWYGSSSASETPDRLDVSLDKPAYAAGDEMRLRVAPRRAGKARIDVLSNRLVSSQFVSLNAGENIVPLAVTPDWGAGAYVTVSHVSAMKSEDSFLPTRAIGLVYAPIEPAEKRLSLTLDAPEVMQPRAPLKVQIKADGLTAGEDAYVTLAAVDAGILGLTGFEPPNPEEHYFAQRKLGVELRDLYGRLIDSSKGAMGQTRSGGDVGQEASLDGVPPTDELVTFFAGPVTLGLDGTAEISFDMPAFNGTLRLMAVAWSKTGLGSASSDVIVRDPVVLSASAPGVLTPGDESLLHLELTHADGPTGAGTATITAPALLGGKAQASFAFDLAEGERKSFNIPLRAARVGDFPLIIQVTTPEGRELIKELTLPVRFLDPETSSTRRLTLGAGQSLRLDANLAEAYRTGSARALLTAGPVAKFDVAGLLTELDRYPYGCTEQLTSAAMPLLYFAAVGDALGLGAASDVSARIDKALARILTRQTGNGSFGMWYPSSGNLWLDAYVTDFLSRAKTRGFDVPDAAFASAISNLRNGANAHPDFDKGGEGLAYALYVLAREGQTSVSDLRYYADVKADAFSTPLAQAQIGAALTYHGDQLRADAMFTRAAARLAAPTASESYVWRADYGTHRRDAAAVLALGQEAGSKSASLSALAAQITGGDVRASTQEMVWSLLAVEGLLASAPPLTLDGMPLALPVLRADHTALSAGQELANTSSEPLDVTLTTFGVPKASTAPTGYGYRLERRFYSLDGTPLESLSVAAGDRVVVHLRATPFESSAARLIVNDPLPAGFAIDNPHLLNAGDVKALGWLKPSHAEATEFRTERFIAAVNIRKGEPVELAYIIRALTPGRYHHAAALVEDMYRPAYRATTASSEAVISVR